MRGKQLSSAADAILSGITPAHAGKTEIQYLLDREIKDHPRACGENTLRYVGGLRMTGSPPRMRGKLFLHSRLPPRPRITPAHAGKTQAACDEMQ